MRRKQQRQSDFDQNFDFQTLEPRQLLAVDVLSISLDGVWHQVSSDASTVATGQNLIKATNYRLFDVQEDQLLDTLNSAPLEFTPGFEANAAVISIPTPTGEFEQFAIVEAPVVHPELARQFPGIHTYRGVGLDNPANSIRLDYTEHGFHAQVLSPDGAYYVDPYYHLQTDVYMSYFKRDGIRDPQYANSSELLLDDQGEVIFATGEYRDLIGSQFEISDHAVTSFAEGEYHVDEDGNAWVQNATQWTQVAASDFHFHSDGSIHVHQSQDDASDLQIDAQHEHQASDDESEEHCEGCKCAGCQAAAGRVAPDFGDQLRTYDTAIATTGEYTQFWGGSQSQGLSAVVTALNRVNGIYERDVAVRMELVPNNNVLIFTNPNTDPYTNNNGAAMLSQNQSTVDARIGSANYDVGHVFSTGGGGIASLGVIGQNGAKAQGVTGLPSPTGDGFYIDFVAHEMGHQYGANHTFNGDSGSCAGNQRDQASAYEPGSGSTILGYAGICGNDNLQTFSHAMFHSRSIDQIRTEVTTGTGNAAATITNTGNAIPSVDAGAVYWIPDQTPFELTAVGSDPDGGSLTYSWEQRDLGPRRDVNASDNGFSPIWRSWLPTTSPTRSFPRLSNVLAGNTVVGEQYATTNWLNMDFRVVLRDNALGGGGVVSDDTFVRVVNSGTGFDVTSQATTTDWTGLDTETVTWNVAGTTGNGINAATVDIYFATNSSNFDIVLATGVPNDGSHDITVPNLDVNFGRIKVKASDNIFYDVNRGNIRIDPVVAVPSGIDFGPIGSPGHLDYAQVLDEPYSSAVGYGWNGFAGLVGIEENRGSNLIRDKVSLQGGNFLIDVPNGTYEVGVVLGVVKKTDAIQIFMEDSFDTFVPQPGPNVIRNYTTTVNDGQLTIGFDGLSGLNDRIIVSGINLSQTSGRPTNGNGGAGKNGISGPPEDGASDSSESREQLVNFFASSDLDFSRRAPLELVSPGRQQAGRLDATQLAQLSGAILNLTDDGLQELPETTIKDSVIAGDFDAQFEFELLKQL